MHSAFGFKNRNEHLKHLFHALSNIIDQLVFNVHLQLTLLLLHPILQQRESPETLDFLMMTNGTVPGRGMQKVKEHPYVVGSLVQQHLSTTLCELLLEVHPSSQVRTSTWAFYNGVRYHSKAYIKKERKRNGSDLSLQQQWTLQIWTNWAVCPYPRACGHCKGISIYCRNFAATSWANMSSSSWGIQAHQHLEFFRSWNKATRRTQPPRGDSDKTSRKSSLCTVEQFSVRLCPNTHDHNWIDIFQLSADDIILYCITL